MDSIIRDALVLPPEQRVMLANMLMSSVNEGEDPDPAVEAAWHDVIVARMARFDAGLEKTIPAEEVFATLQQRLRKING